MVKIVLVNLNEAGLDESSQEVKKPLVRKDFGNNCCRGKAPLGSGATALGSVMDRKSILHGFGFPFGKRLTFQLVLRPHQKRLDHFTNALLHF